MNPQLSHHRHVFRTLIASCLWLTATSCTASDADQNPDVSRQLGSTCIECHAEGKAAIPGWPPIKYMSREEITERLTTYRDQRVPESRMSDVTHRFSDEDIAAIAEYFARLRLQPRE